MKKCSKCKSIKSIDSFTRDKSRPDGLSYICKECSRLKYQSSYTKVGVNRKTKKIEMVGKVFGRLIVVSESHIENTAYHWICVCSCDDKKKIIVSGRELRNGNIISCGCHRDELLQNKPICKSKSPEYRSWICMKNRCYYKKDKDYYNYGGRGIKVCDRWLESFENFYEDMGLRPEHCSLDRKDNNQDYYKENCKWSTRQEQSKNKRNVVYIEYDGRKMILSDWAKEVNKSAQCIGHRLSSGMTIEEALFTPVNYRRTNVQDNT